MSTARTLAEASAALQSVRRLYLRASPDLVCRNIMCEKLQQACACRLAVVVSRLTNLEELDVRDNGLDALPEAIFELPKLRVLQADGVYFAFPVLFCHSCVT